MRWKYLVMTVILTLALSPGSLEAQDNFELNYQSIYAGPHILNLEVLKPWTEALEEKTSGTLKMHFFMSGAIVKPEEVVPALINGTLDSASGMVIYQDTLMPRLQATDLYHVARDCEHSSEIFWQMYMQLPEMRQELEKVGKVLTVWGSDRSGFFSTKDPIRNPEDLRGKRVLIWSGGQVDMIRSWGGIPVQVSTNDTYMSLQRGMGDVFFGPLPTGVAFKLMEVSKEITVIPAHVGMSAMWINWDVWEDLPKDLQAALEEGTGREMNLRCGQTLKAATDRDIETMRSAGCNVYMLRDEELQRFVEADAHILKAFLLTELKRLGVEDAQEWVRRVNAVIDSVP